MILVIDKSMRTARNLCDMLYYMGFLSHAATPTEALSEISTLYRAVIITGVQSIAAPDEYTERLRSYAKSVPIFAITEKEESKYEGLFAKCFTRGAYAAKIAEQIIEYCDEQELDIPGHYTLAGIDASADITTPTYLDAVLPFTKTELMILRYLIRAYPTPQDADKILKYAYKQSRVPEAANIRTHISVMNKKFKAITGRPIIQPTFGEGYYIFTPEKALALSK